MGDYFFVMLTELRKELVESQKIRAQMIGLKLTVITAAAGGSVIAFSKDQNPTLLCILLFIASLITVSFDYLINSYSYSIRRIGYYIRNHLEPNIFLPEEVKLFKLSSPHMFLKWEDFLYEYEYSGNHEKPKEDGKKPKKAKRRMIGAIIGNLGITASILVGTIISLFVLKWPIESQNGWLIIIAVSLLFISLLIFTAYNYISVNSKFDNECAYDTAYEKIKSEGK